MGVQKKKWWARHNFASMSCCDLDLQCSDPNIALDMSPQYGNHFCEKVVKPDFK